MSLLPSCRFLFLSLVFFISRWVLGGFSADLRRWRSGVLESLERRRRREWDDPRRSWPWSLVIILIRGTVGIFVGTTIISPTLAFGLTLTFSCFCYPRASFFGLNLKLLLLLNLKLFCIFFGLTLANEDRIHDYLTNSVGDILAHFVQYVFLLNTYLWQSHMTIAMSGDLAMENGTHFSSRAPFGPLNASWTMIFQWEWQLSGGISSRQLRVQHMTKAQKTLLAAHERIRFRYCK